MSVDIVREHLEMAVAEARRRQGEIDLLRQQLAEAVEALRKIADPKCGHGIAGDGYPFWDSDAGYRIAREWLAANGGQS